MPSQDEPIFEFPPEDHWSLYNGGSQPRIENALKNLVSEIIAGLAPSTDDTQKNLDYLVNLATDEIKWLSGFAVRRAVAAAIDMQSDEEWQSNHE
jgi:hypothetical protein